MRATESKAIYRHVPPGQYVFHVIACNSDCVWSDDNALLAVTVNPHFYQTAWFRGGAGLLAVAGLSARRGDRHAPADASAPGTLETASTNWSASGRASPRICTTTWARG